MQAKTLFLPKEGRKELMLVWEHGKGKGLRG